MRPRVVVIGGGFGGLRVARGLVGADVEVTLLDRTNYHLFTPLLYQVASCLLSPDEIAEPLRKIFRRALNVEVMRAEVQAVDDMAREVLLADGRRLPYDRLVLASGSTTNTFGREDVARHAFDLKDLPGALEIRNHVLRCLERAVETAPEERRGLITFCVVGGGPTGVEMAGAFAELVRLVVPLEYRELHRHEVRVVLLEGTDRILATFAPRLGSYAHARLERLGVEVRTGVLVERIDQHAVLLSDGTELVTDTVIWAAGVSPDTHARPADAPTGPGGRLVVDDKLRVVGLDGVFAIGDLAAARPRRGADRPLPMVAQPAIQEGRHVAAEIRRELAGKPARAFHYHDLGSMATVGRQAAVAEIGPLQFTGFPAFVLWTFVHIAYLIGFDNRLAVMMRWAWYYVRWDRPVRLELRARDRHAEFPDTA